VRCLAVPTYVESYSPNYLAGPTYTVTLDGPHTLTLMLYDNWYYHNILVRMRLTVPFIMYDKCCYHKIIMTKY
jgi:hypothetical protein